MQIMQAHKAHSLIGQVYDPRNLARAWERVKQNKGAGGVDGVTVARFEEKRDFYLDLLQQRLKDGSYRPRPVRRVEIDKPGSVTKRALGIPTVMDRVCQQAVVQILEPIFEPTSCNLCTRHGERTVPACQRPGFCSRRRHHHRTDCRRGLPVCQPPGASFMLPLD